MKIIIITIIIKHTANSNNYCNKNINNNNLLILDVKQLNKIIKLYCFYTLKALFKIVFVIPPILDTRTKIVLPP